MEYFCPYCETYHRRFQSCSEVFEANASFDEWEPDDEILEDKKKSRMIVTSQKTGSTCKEK